MFLLVSFLTWHLHVKFFKIKFALGKLNYGPSISGGKGIINNETAITVLGRSHIASLNPVNLLWSFTDALCCCLYLSNKHLSCHNHFLFICCSYFLEKRLILNAFFYFTDDSHICKY